ncbi:dihydrofolate reductase [Schaalia turicensis]|uniref:dihydrofolate reductase n=1 Tax=Schaalia turicensis TaxID=131111 RepID=UPI0036C84691
MLIAQIWAEAHGHALAKGLRLPWNVPEDSAFFRAAVRGRPVIMGRKTWISTGRRPMPHSPTIVVSTQEDFEVPGAQLAVNLEEAFALARATGADAAWVCGGAGIYAETRACSQVLIRTVIDADVDADIFAPAITPEWELRLCSPGNAHEGWHTSRAGLRYRYEVWARPGVAIPENLLPVTPDAAWQVA